MQISARIAAGVSVIPAAGLKRIALEAVDAVPFTAWVRSLQPRTTKPSGSPQPPEPPADNQHPDLVGQRFAAKARIDVRIVHVTAEVALHLDVLLIAVGADTPIALLAVLGAQGVGIEIDSGITILGGRNFYLFTHRDSLAAADPSDR